MRAVASLLISALLILTYFVFFEGNNTKRIPLKLFPGSLIVDGLDSDYGVIIQYKDPEESDPIPWIQENYQHEIDISSGNESGVIKVHLDFIYSKFPRIPSESKWRAFRNPSHGNGLDDYCIIWENLNYIYVFKGGL